MNNEENQVNENENDNAKVNENEANKPAQDPAGEPRPHDNVSDKDPQTIADAAPADEEVEVKEKPDAPDAKQVEDNADRNPTTPPGKGSEE